MLQEVGSGKAQLCTQYYACDALDPSYYFFVETEGNIEDQLQLSCITYFNCNIVPHISCFIEKPSNVQMYCLQAHLYVT